MRGGGEIARTMSDMALEEGYRNVMRLAREGRDYNGARFAEPLEEKRGKEKKSKENTEGGGNEVTVQEARERGIRSAANRDKKTIEARAETTIGQQRANAKRLQEAEIKLETAMATLNDMYITVKKQEAMLKFLADAMKLAYGEDWLQKLKEMEGNAGDDA